MYKIGNTDFKLCLFDTNAISFIIKHQESLKMLFDRFPFPDYLYIYSPYVVYELSKNEVVFELFKDKFSIFPSLLLKNETELLVEENKKPNNPEIWTINPSAITGDGSARNKLDIALSLTLTSKRVEEIKEKIAWNYETMKEWGDWGKSYLEKDSKEIIKYRIIEAFGLNLIGSLLRQDISNIKFDQFPSIKILAYSWFYKFVSDKNRKTTENDVVDILNSAYVYYSSVYICENNLKDVLNKLKAKGIINKIDILSAATLKIE
jgi:hypothetical protein